MQKRRVFICHSSEDKAQAVSINRAINNSLKDTESFCSSDVESIPYGDWFDRIILELKSADALVIIASANSVNKNWVNFEFGAFFALHGKTTIHVLSLDNTTLPDPLGRLQAKDAFNPNALTTFFRALANTLKTEFTSELDFETLSTELVPQATVEVGVVGGVKPSTSAPKGELPNSAIAEGRQFTLFFRNNSAETIRGIKLRVSGRQLNGEPFRLRGIDNVHIAPRTEHLELETTDKWTEIAPNSVEPLCLTTSSWTLQEITCQIHVEFKNCSLRTIPGPFDVSVVFPASNVSPAFI